MLVTRYLAVLWLVRLAHVAMIIEDNKRHQI